MVPESEGAGQTPAERVVAPNHYGARARPEGRAYTVVARDTQSGVAAGDDRLGT